MAVDQMRKFMLSGPVTAELDIKKLINEGRS
jgi:hypothetical protein